MPKSKSENKSKIENTIDWTDENIPVSTRFEDPYYSKADGLLETKHVFINGNNLPARWPGLAKCTIAELGFGTGLNFLVTVHEWQKVAAKNARLNFISFEKYPMCGEEMVRALSRWPHLKEDASALASQWDNNLSLGKKTIKIKWSDQVTLTVLIGDANLTHHSHFFIADAWYFDGFSPAKNPDLWSLDLMRQLYDKTVPKGSFATYTAAGWVRRNLQSAGFTVERIAGHAGKRQMSVGRK